MIKIKTPILKHRHLLTRGGNIRMRYVVVTVCVLMLGIWGGMTSYTTTGNAYQKTSARPDMVVDLAPAGGEDTGKILSDDPEQAGRGLEPYYAFIGQKPVFEHPYQWTKTITVKSGDTLGQIMEQTPLSGDAYFAAMKALRKHVDPRDIKPGQKVEIHFTTLNNKNDWNAIDYRINGLEMVSIRRDAHGQIIADKQEKAVETKIHAARARVNSSIFADLGKAGVPDGVINRMIKAYSWSVDFQRDIWGGETVELLYETNETDDGSYMRSGRLLYANMNIRGKEMPIYLFEKEKGYESFFEPNGQSIRKALLKTPVDGARLSSGYGRRKHPVLGYTKMHKGVDFAAPTGTPIYAAGDGVVERANRFSSFGNYMRIRHNDKYKTVYAHLHGFAKGMRAGTRVKQGQIIGYVGTTGRSTGPHLHYEIHVNGKAVNPQSVDLPIGEKLQGTKLANFKKVMNATKQQFASVIRKSSTYAAFDESMPSSNAAN